MLTRIENSRIIHFLGLSTTTVYAQYNCSGAYQASTTQGCPVGCGIIYPDTGSGSDACTGFRNTFTFCTDQEDCYGTQGRMTCGLPDCP